MQIIKRTVQMQETSKWLRASGKTISLVPTMGFLHQGHLELMKVAKGVADILVVSIFVNPTQFGPGEDFEEYPRDMEGDLSKAREIGADIVYTPSTEDMYPEGFQTKVLVEGITRYLCGVSRPGHFEGVTTVVTKLFNVTKPHKAIFGQKDFQQLMVIRRMVEDLNMDIEIIGVPTVREPDGLAMSSRNKYLSNEERKSALCLKKSLDMASDMVRSGETNAEEIRTSIQKLISSHPFTDIEYVSICDPLTMEDVNTINGEALLALAVRVGKTRLIDNCLIIKRSDT